jgi:hypothetical protein
VLQENGKYYLRLQLPNAQSRALSTTAAKGLIDYYEFAVGEFSATPGADMPTADKLEHYFSDGAAVKIAVTEGKFYKI